MLSNDLIELLVKENQQLKQGFYEYKNRIYFSKIEALIAATKERSNIRFIFNDHVFSTLSWQIEPDKSLQQFYQQRAKQLREKYDHIVLLYSGGADSTNVLRSFLHNNILLDEIWSLMARNYSINSLTDRSNLEIFKAAHPNLKIAEKKGIIIKLKNMLDHYNESPFAEDWFLDTSGTRLSADDGLRKSILLNNAEIKKLVDAGKKVCYLFGFDKPRIRLDGEDWSFGVMDTNHGWYWKSALENKDGPFFEFFYLTPDLPEMAVKSVHVLVHAFEKKFSSNECKKFFSNGHVKNLDFYNTFVNNTLYAHHWNPNTFSLGKNKDRFCQFFDQKASFLFDRPMHWNQYKTWLGGITEVQSQLNPAFYTPLRQITGHWSTIYKIKKLKSKIA